MILLKLELSAKCIATKERECLDPDGVDFRCLTAGNRGACQFLCISKARNI